MHDAYAAQRGRKTGPLGYPVTDPICGLRPVVAPGIPGRPLLDPRHRHAGAGRPHPRQVGRPGLAERRARLPDDGRQLRPRPRRLLPDLPGRRGVLVRRHRSADIAGAVLAEWGAGNWEAGILGYPTTGADLRPARRRLLAGLPGRLHPLVPRHRRADHHRRPSSPPGHARAGRTADWATPPRARTAACAAAAAGSAFQGGYIYWSPATGAQVITGAILAAWARAGLAERPTRLPDRWRDDLAAVWLGSPSRAASITRRHADGVRVTYR